MATEPKRRKIASKSATEQSDEDRNLEKELLQLVDDVIKKNSLTVALASLQRLIRTSTTSLTAVPKPLKYLKDSYAPLKAAYDKLSDCPEKRALAEVISILATTRPTPDQKRECLKYCLKGSQDNPGDWGHEYVVRLHVEIDAEWTSAPLDREEETM